MQNHEMRLWIELARTVVSGACGIINQENKRGGYMCIADAAGNTELACLIGTVSDQLKDEKYLRLCIEKARRLGQHPHHFTSWQTRDEDKLQYGGAIRAKDLILSFSGLPELWDEACMLALAYHMKPRRISSEEITSAIMLSENPHVSILITATTDESQQNRM